MSSWHGPWRDPGRLRPFDPAARRLLRGTGGRLATAAGLALLAALALATVLEPHWRRTASALDARPRAAPDAATPSHWPAADAHVQRIGTLLALARRHGVQVRGLREDAAPDALDDRAGGVAWRVLALSAEGSYAALRGFAASALAADPALALDHLLLQRADTGQDLLRAELGLALGHALPAASAPGPLRQAGAAPSEGSQR